MATLKFKVFVPVSCVISLGTAAGFHPEAAMMGQARRQAAPRRRGSPQVSSIELVEMPFVLRPMLPTDAQHLLRGMRQLMSKRSLFMRFMRPVDGLNATELAYLTDLDYWDRFAWVLGIILPTSCMTEAAAAEACVGASADFREIGVGVSRYIRVQDPGAGSYNAVRSDPHCAEAALQTTASSLEDMLQARHQALGGSEGGGTLPQPQQPDTGATAAAAAATHQSARGGAAAASTAQTGVSAHTALLKGTFRAGVGPTVGPASRRPPSLQPIASSGSGTSETQQQPPTPRGKSASATAELAVTVADSFHQCGFATLMLWALSQVAQRHGMQHFVGVSHEDNFKVRSTLQQHAACTEWNYHTQIFAGARTYGQTGGPRHGAGWPYHPRGAGHAVLCAAAASAHAAGLHCVGAHV